MSGYCFDTPAQVGGEILKYVGLIAILLVCAFAFGLIYPVVTQSYSISWSPSWRPKVGATITATFTWDVSFDGHTPPSNLKNKFYIKDPKGNIKASKELSPTESGSTSLSVKTDYAGYWVAEMHIYYYSNGWREGTWSEKKYVNTKIHVETTPSGAKVSITDLGVSGTSPCTLPAKPGYHWVSITKSGYKHWCKKIYISPEGDTSLSVTLEEKPTPKYYDLTVETIPSGAKVYLSGVEGYKISPCTFKDLISGWYTIIVRKEGYNEARQNVFLDEDKTVTITLEPKTYTLTVKTNPAYANVTIVELGITKNSGTRGAVFELDYGTYTVRVEKEGYGVVEKVIELDSDKTITISLYETKPVIEITPEINLVATLSLLAVAAYLLWRYAI
ncbi:MAG: hypothetical protein DRP18_05170 [Candidatus Aenigmatarchaeota archaeon]|nr:MAG: hypothetical protein DRP18_05170 [Candidatus Aenigmarchaeota archaeon]